MSLCLPRDGTNLPPSTCTPPFFSFSTGRNCAEFCAQCKLCSIYSVQYIFIAYQRDLDQSAYDFQKILSYFSEKCGQMPGSVFASVFCQSFVFRDNPQRAKFCNMYSVQYIIIAAHCDLDQSAYGFQRILSYVGAVWALSLPDRGVTFVAW